MKTTLIITTYNWKEALKAVLESVKRQTVLPDEVIVADDGSRDDTKAMIDQLRDGFPVPLIHSWHEDNGFQLSMSRNRAIAKASGDYLIMIDGDMVLSQTFIESHKQVAKPNWFVQGGRVLTDENCSKAINHVENSRASLGQNDEILENTIKNKLKRCENGVDQFLEA
ncbi:glycosyltransferase [Vibrio alginolyticus]